MQVSDHGLPWLRRGNDFPTLLASRTGIDAQRTVYQLSHIYIKNPIIALACSRAANMLLKGITLLAADGQNFAMWAVSFMAVVAIAYAAGHNAILGFPKHVTEARKIEDDKQGMNLITVAVSGPLALQIKDIGATTAKEVWDYLDKRFGKITPARRQQLMSQLMAGATASTTKPFDVLSYIEEKKSIRRMINTGSEVADSVSEPVLCTAILNGLPEQYDSFISAINVTGCNYTLDELTDRLTNEQTRIRSRADELDAANSMMATFMRAAAGTVTRAAGSAAAGPAGAAAATGTAASPTAVRRAAARRAAAAASNAAEAAAKAAAAGAYTTTQT